jgi:hypothetical protein
MHSYRGCVPVHAHVKHLLLSTRHTYDSRHVELHFFACDLDAEPHPRLGQEIRWAPRAELKQLALPAADAELIELLSMEQPR